MTAARLSFNKKVTIKAAVEAKREANPGQNTLAKTRLNPTRVIKVASGTMRIFKKTLIGEKIRKLYAIIPAVPSQADKETKKPSRKNPVNPARLCLTLSKFFNFG